MSKSPEYLSCLRQAAVRGLLDSKSLFGRLAFLLCVPFLAAGQTLDLHDEVRTLTGLTNTTATLTGRAELRITGRGDPIPGCTIQLNSPDAWLLLTGIAPSQVASTFLGRIRVNGANAVLDGTVRVVQYAQGAVVVPHAPDFAPLEVFDGRYFTGAARKLNQFVKYNDARLGAMTGNIASFKLKRGYEVTFASEPDGTGTSRNYVAQDGDLELGRLPGSLENQVRFVRIFPWRWVSKKGIAGNLEANLDVDWLYNWNLSRNSTLDWEYVPIRQNRYWPGLDQNWQTRGSTHLLGYNEPDRPDQADMSVAAAIASWPDLLGTGLRVGSPAVSDGGRNDWLYPFIQQADAAGLRVDFVAVHYYWCHNPADPAGAANRMYNFLKATYDQVKRPLWITEWNNGANWTSCGDPTFAQQEAAIAAMIEMLDNAPFVERYAPFNWVEDVRRLVWDDNRPTAAGFTYRDNAAPLAYRQEHRDSGIGRTTRYRFDGDTHDDGGNGQDAIQIGAPTFTAGRFGQALVLDGEHDYLQLPANVGNSTDFSFAAWVYWNGGGRWQRIFDLGDIGRQNYLYLSPQVSGGSARFTITDSGWNGEQRLNTAALPVGVWTHVAVTIRGDTGKLFVNGTLVAINNSMTVNPSGLGVKYNYLGHSRFSADPNFNGRLDDVRFLTSALSDAQVAALAAGRPPGFTAHVLTAPDAIAYQPYSASITAQASGGIGTLTIEKRDGPAWLSVNANGALSGTPGWADAGTNRFVLRVSDETGGAQLAQLSIVVTNISALAVTTSDTIANSARDAEEAADGTVTLNSTDLELVEESSRQTVGLRFDLPVPPGAVITEARIQFTADETQSEPTQLSIATEAADDSATFTTASHDLSARSRNSLTAPWQPAPWTAGEAGPAQLTPNLAAIVQDVVSRPGWQAGNTIAFIITGTGHRTAESFNKSGGTPPVLTLSFLTPSPLFTATATVTDGTNDAEQAASGAMNLTSSDLELVHDAGTGAGDQIVGLRFDNLGLPPGALIAGAHLQFTADEAQNDATTLTLRAQAADFAPGFTTSANDLGARPLTTASVTWSPAPWATQGERGPLQQTPDLSALVSEVLKRPGWTNGSALAFLINGSGHRTAESANKGGGSPATLTVKYWTEPPVGTYARWAASHPGHEPFAADLDGDGDDSLFEYAVGSDPAVPNRGPLSLTFDDTWLYLIYTRSAMATDVDFQVEWTPLFPIWPWTSSGVVQEVLSDDGLRRTIQATVPKGSSGRRFVRLRVIH